MIENVDFKKTTFASGHQKFEAGTPPIAEVIGLGASYDFMSQFNLQEIFKYEKELYEYAVDKLQSFNDVHIIGHSKNKGAILSFTIENIHPNDIGIILDQHNVAVRAGHHGAQPLLKKLNLKGTVRASLGIYNNKSDIDCLVESIKETKKFFSS